MTARLPSRRRGRAALDGARDVVVAFSTAGSAEEAEHIAHTLVGERLAACVNLLPATSIYRWRGVVERAPEVLLVIKTRQSRLASLSARLRAVHSYEVPELIAVPIAAGSSSYLAWLLEETASAPAPRRSTAASRHARPRSR